MGEVMEVDGYLRKFIDLRYSLPEPKMTQYYNYLCTEYGLWEYISKNRPSEYQNLFGLNIAELFKITDLSLREIDHLFVSVNLVMRTSPIQLDWVLIFFLLLLKTKRINLYKELFTNNIDIIQYLSELVKIDNWVKLFDSTKEDQALYLLGRRVLSDLIEYTTKYADLTKVQSELSTRLNFSNEYLEHIFQYVILEKENQFGKYNKIHAMLQIIELQNKFSIKRGNYDISN